MKTPQLWIIAGPNGSGKTTLNQKYSHFFRSAVPFINPDDIALRMDPNNKDSTQVILRAGKEAVSERNRLLNGRLSFGFETTLSGKKELQLIEQAKLAGYKINFIFICLDEPNLNIFRVRERVLSGGHKVEPEIVVRRYFKSLENAKKILQIADRSYVIDNSSERYKLIFKKEKTVVWFTEEVPAWVNTLEAGFSL
jgi:predicted ABC-type ATPase